MKSLEGGDELPDLRHALGVGPEDESKSLGSSGSPSRDKKHKKKKDRRKKKEIKKDKKDERKGKEKSAPDLERKKRRREGSSESRVKVLAQKDLAAVWPHRPRPVSFVTEENSKKGKASHAEGQEEKLKFNVLVQEQQLGEREPPVQRNEEGEANRSKSTGSSGSSGHRRDEGVSPDRIRPDVGPRGELCAAFGGALLQVGAAPSHVGWGGSGGAHPLPDSRPRPPGANSPVVRRVVSEAEEHGADGGGGRLPCESADRVGPLELDMVASSAERKEAVQESQTEWKLRQQSSKGEDRDPHGKGKKGEWKGGKGKGSWNDGKDDWRKKGDEKGKEDDRRDKRKEKK